MIRLEYIVIVLVICIMLIWIYSPHLSRNNSRQQQTKEALIWIQDAINHVCKVCNMSPMYTIVETRQITYTYKILTHHNVSGTIYLAIWDDTHDTIFSYNTLIYAALHEIAHILSPSTHHAPPFNTIETLLLDTAGQLGYYNADIAIDPNYITLDMTYT